MLLAARSRAAVGEAARGAARPDCEKTYLAEVEGSPPDQGAATAPIGRAGRRGGRVRDRVAARTRCRRTPSGRCSSAARRSTLVRARLHAGRAHQVRAHLAAAGFPIVGDDVYGDAAARATAGAPSGLRLHAHTIALPHPLTGAPLLIEAPPPPWAILRA